MGFCIDKIAHHIAVDLGFDPRDNAVFEPHWNTEGLCDYVFANREDHSNIIIQFFPDDLDIDWDGT